jgi:hypothetical protein
MAANFYYCIVRYSIMARIICTEICGGHAKKSSKWFYNSAPKVEYCTVVLLSVFNLPSSREHQINFKNIIFIKRTED